VRFVVRSFVVGSVILVAACASLAGLEDPAPASGTDTPPSDSDSGSSAVPEAPTNDGASSSGGPTPEPDAAASGDAEVDAPPPPTLCQPPKRPDDDPCATPAECCSNACSEGARCRRGCKTGTLDLCNLLADECCIGLYCALAAPPLPVARCKACLPAGSSPEGGNLKSCCSRALDATGKCSD